LFSLLALNILKVLLAVVQIAEALRKDGGSIPDVLLEIFFDTILPIALRPTVRLGLSHK
jgi:hypothetical protein